MNKEGFAKFKNRLLGGTFLRDTNHWAEILGDLEFAYWERIQEKAPYRAPNVDIKLTNVEKGRVIFERIEKETSPKRLVDHLQAIYEAYFWYFGTPDNYGDNSWQVYAQRLMGIANASGFSDMQIAWKEELEVGYTPPPLSERYYLPGILEVSYIGEDWGTEESLEMLQNGFHSEELEKIIARRKEEKEEKARRGNDIMTILKNTSEAAAGLFRTLGR